MERFRDRVLTPIRPIGRGSARRVRLAGAAAALILFIPLSLLGAGCGKGKEATEAAKRAPAPAAEVPVRVAAAERVSIPRKVEFVGTLAGIEQVAVSSEVEGAVEAIRADLGDPVRKGQLLLSIDPDAFTFRVEQARAEVAQIAAKLGVPPEAREADLDRTSVVLRAQAEFNNTRTDLERRRGLSEKNLIARKEVDDAEARFLVAEANLRGAREEANNLLATLRSKQAQLALAEKNLRATRVVSPIDGFVESRLVSAGEYIKVGTPLFRLVDDRPIRMLGEVPEAYAASLRAGLAVDLSVDGRPGKVYRGKLNRISPSSKEASRAILIEALFPNADRELKSGFFGKGAILVRVDPDAVAIPKSAVVTFAGIEKAFVVSGGAARERIVRLGEDLGDRVEVVDGVKAGEPVAVTNTGKLVEGTKVTEAAGEAK